MLSGLVRPSACTARWIVSPPDSSFTMSPGCSCIVAPSPTVTVPFSRYGMLLRPATARIFHSTSCAMFSGSTPSAV